MHISSVSRFIGFVSFARAYGPGFPVSGAGSHPGGAPVNSRIPTFGRENRVKLAGNVNAATMPAVSTYGGISSPTHAEEQKNMRLDFTLIFCSAFLF